MLVKRKPSLQKFTKMRTGVESARQIKAILYPTEILFRREDKENLLKRLTKNKETSIIFKNSQNYHRFTTEASQSVNSSGRRKTIHDISECQRPSCGVSPVSPIEGQAGNYKL